jgi:hypothetical protein
MCATKTAIIIFSREGVLIWAIPPLSTQPLDLRDHFLDSNPTHIPPLFKIPFPNGIVRHTPEIIEWMTACPWYLGSWESVYFVIFYTDSKLQRFKIIIKPDLSDASLHFMNTTETISDDLMKSLEEYTVSDGYRICEGALVYSWDKDNCFEMWGAYTGLTSAPFTSVVKTWRAYNGSTSAPNVVPEWNRSVHSLCPTSGRFAFCIADEGDGNVIHQGIAVVDLF